MTSQEIQTTITMICSLACAVIGGTYIYFHRNIINDVQTFMKLVNISSLKEYHDERERIKLLLVEAKINHAKSDIEAFVKPTLEKMIVEHPMPKEMASKFKELFDVGYGLVLTINKEEREANVKELFPLNADMFIRVLKEGNEL